MQDLCKVTVEGRMQYFFPAVSGNSQMNLETTLLSCSISQTWGLANSLGCHDDSLEFVVVKHDTKMGRLQW